MSKYLADSYDAALRENADLKARLAEAERDRDLWHARAISLFWNPGEETTCAAVRTDADLAMEWIKAANKASDSASGNRCAYCGVPDGDGHTGDCQHPALSDQPEAAAR